MNTLERLRYLSAIERWDSEGFYIDKYSVEQDVLKKLLAVVEAAKEYYHNPGRLLMSTKLHDALAALEDL